ncbi:hypothetical protein ATK36_0597 [Amycolatopsis sulphurea]|uniref:Uncharacterized protein n=1 Tax=Amycolatopsis sulphurea TaxID=76022 RepID=A0A2A9G046_9PSEU|nr:hypothetical protein ATK36_0597 [Amycolatopsis sulphurea]
MSGRAGRVLGKWPLVADSGSPLRAADTRPGRVAGAALAGMAAGGPPKLG